MFYIADFLIYISALEQSGQCKLQLVYVYYTTAVGKIAEIRFSLGHEEHHVVKISAFGTGQQSCQFHGAQDGIGRGGDFKEKTAAPHTREAIDG